MTQVFYRAFCHRNVSLLLVTDYTRALLTSTRDEYVIFVTPTALQLSIFSKILNPDRLDNIIEHSTAESLALINILTKISNSPILLKAVVDKAKAKISQGEDNRERATVVEEAVKLLPERAQVEDLSLSGDNISRFDNKHN